MNKTRDKYLYYQSSFNGVADKLSKHHRFYHTADFIELGIDDKWLEKHDLIEKVDSLIILSAWSEALIRIMSVQKEIDELIQHERKGDDED